MALPEKSPGPVGCCEMSCGCASEVWSNVCLKARGSLDRWPHGDAWQCSETFWVAAAGRQGCYCTKWGEAWDGPKYPTTPGAASHNKGSSNLHVYSAGVWEQSPTDRLPQTTPPRCLTVPASMLAPLKGCEGSICSTPLSQGLQMSVFLCLFMLSSLCISPCFSVPFL